MRLALFLCSERDNSLVNSSASVVMPASVTMSVPDSTYVVPSVPVPRTSPSSPKSWKDGGKSDAVDVCALVTAAKNRGSLPARCRERKKSIHLLAMHVRMCHTDNTRDADFTMFNVMVLMG